MPEANNAVVGSLPTHLGSLFSVVVESLALIDCGFVAMLLLTLTQ